MFLLKAFHDLARYRELLIYLVSTDLKIRFRRSVLGYAWSLLYPLMTMGILALVFTRIMHFPDLQNYTLYIFSGLLPWQFIVNGLIGAGGTIVSNESIIKKVYMPLMVFPVASALGRFVDFLFNLAAVFILVSFISFRPSWALFALPFAVFLLFVFTMGISVAISAINVCFRDSAHLVSVFLQLLFYLTPIIYPEDHPLIPSEHRWLFDFNPIAHFIRLFHIILYEGAFPSFQAWGLASGIAIGALLVGVWLFSKLERKLIFWL